MHGKNNVFRLPPRKGNRPRTDNAVPHLQKSQRSPTWLREDLRAWVVDNLEDVREEDTRISVSATRAFWLAEDVEVAREDAFMPPAGSREFAHLHVDGSLHLCLSNACVEEIVEKAWGEVHPLRDKGVNEVLLYAPRDGEELAIARYAVAESWSYATGRPNPLPPPPGV